MILDDFYLNLGPKIIVEFLVYSYLIVSCSSNFLFSSVGWEFNVSVYISNDKIPLNIDYYV